MAQFGPVYFDGDFWGDSYWGIEADPVGRPARYFADTYWGSAYFGDAFWGQVYVPPKRDHAGGSHKRRNRYIKLPEDLEREEREEREAQELEQAQAKTKTKPKRARRSGKSSRGIQLAPEADAAEQFRAAEILAARNAELMAQQQAARTALLAEELAMLQAAASIEAENEIMMLLLMAA